MDKETLSNYGWITIVTLVLAVMLTFATPFGTYIGNGVVSIARGYVATSEKKLNNDNVKEMGSKWDGKFENGVASGEDNVIPNGAKYIRKLTSCPRCGNAIPAPNSNYSCLCGTHSKNDGIKECEICHYNFVDSVCACGLTHYTDYCPETIYSEGEEFPSEVKINDEYQYGDYIYTYNVRPGSNEIFEGGWHIGIKSQNKESYGEILSSINGQKVIDMCLTFAGCTSLTTAPKIPDTITNMFYAFIDCGSLTGTVTIDANPTIYEKCFNNTTKPIILTGSSTMLNKLATTANKGNVTVK